MATHINNNHPLATNMKKIIFYIIISVLYMGLIVKEIYVFDCIELLFFNGLFQNNYFEEHISQKTKLNYRWL